MLPEQSPNALAVEIDGTDFDNAATELPPDDFADVADAPSSGETPQGAAKSAAIFKIVAEDQIETYQALNERIERLEQDRNSQSLHETVRSLFEAVSGFVSEMDRRMSQAENRIAAIVQTVESFVDSVESASSDFEQLNVAAQERIATLHEHLNSAEVRIAQVEGAVTELKASDAGALSAIDGLSGNFHVLKDKLSGEMNATEVRVENAISDLKANDTKNLAAFDGLSENFTILKDKLSRGLNAAEVRVGQVEDGLVQLKGSDAKAFAAIEELLENLDGIKDKLARSLHSAEVRVGHVEDGLADLKGKDIKALAAVDGLLENMEHLKDKISRDLNSGEARVVQVEREIAELRGTDAKAFTAIDALSGTLDLLDDKLDREQKEAARLGDRVRLAEHKVANWTDCEARVAALSKRVSELRDMEKSLREVQGQSDQSSADICTLSEGIRMLQSGVGSVNTEFRQLRDRMEEAEGGIAASLEQSQSLARLHVRLAETYALKTG